ncbi:hypothetical protein MLD38_022115 [Melastoma candidum]|uniref:Uncharacterized protein n=1 Tax=Melastoma candidum TaxID=119954 RepID=A0ACB9QIE6_9MYRT|nr:hypothetical protein MLD38_022115 [Melastoma candidum]
MKVAAETCGVRSIAIEGNDLDQLVVTGEGIDSACLATTLRKKVGDTTILKIEEDKPKDKKDDKKDEKKCEHYCPPPCNPCGPYPYYGMVCEQEPSLCIVIGRSSRPLVYLLLKMKQKIVIKVCMNCDRARSEAMKIAAKTCGVRTMGIEGNELDQLVVTGEGIDSACLTITLRKKVGPAVIVKIEEVKPAEKEQKKDEKPKCEWSCPPPPPPCKPCGPPPPCKPCGPPPCKPCGPPPCEPCPPYPYYLEACNREPYCAMM